MKQLLLLLILASSLKLLSFYIKVKFKTARKKPISAEEVIKYKGLTEEQFIAATKDIIIDYSRDEEIELECMELLSDLETLVKRKHISKGELYGIEEYLKNQLEDKRRYKNSAHAIFQMLASPHLKINHINTIKQFLYK